MASPLSPPTTRHLLRHLLCRRVISSSALHRPFSTTLRLRDDASSPPPAPPLLQLLRSDLKTALRAKDTQKLLVIRALLADVTDASKTNNPVKTDLQMLALLRKRVAAARQAIAEAEGAGRKDLVEKEEGQVGVLEGYAGKVETWGDDKIRGVLEGVVAEVSKAGAGKVVVGDVLMRIFASGGEMDGKPVERSRVAVIVKELVGKSS